MKVYIVKAPKGEYDDYREPIDKVFLDKEKAEKYVKEQNSYINNTFYLLFIEEHEVEDFEDNNLLKENRLLKEQNERVLEKLELIVKANQELEREKQVLEKALELAMKHSYPFEIEYIRDMYSGREDFVKRSIEYFKKGAKENLKNE